METSLFSYVYVIRIINILEHEREIVLNKSVNEAQRDFSVFVYFVHPKPEIPQSKFRCFHSSISLTKCLSHLLWVTTLKDLQKKKKKQTNKLMCCQETADSSCGIGHAEWDLCLLHTSAPGTLAEREHRRTYSAVTGRLSSLPCSRHLPRCKSTVPHRHLSQGSYRLHCDGALAPIHLAWSVSWKQRNRLQLHVFRMLDGVQTAWPGRASSLWR